MRGIPECLQVGGLHERATRAEIVALRDLEKLLPALRDKADECERAEAEAEALIERIRERAADAKGGGE